MQGTITSLTWVIFAVQSGLISRRFVNFLTGSGRTRNNSKVRKYLRTAQAESAVRNFQDGLLRRALKMSVSSMAVLPLTAKILKYKDSFGMAKCMFSTKGLQFRLTV